MKERGDMLNRVLVLGLLIFSMIGCSESQPERNKAFERDIQSHMSMVSDDSDSKISITELTDFEWDKAYLFEPYISEEEMEQEIGVNFKDQSNIYTRDDISLLLFLKNGEVVHYAELKRWEADFSIGGEAYLTPDRDLLIISR